MKAVIKTGGKQYYVEEGSIIYVEKLNGAVGDKVTFEEVLMKDNTIGNPTIEDASVEGVILKHGKGSKIKIFKYNPKKNYHRTQGHRQPYTKVEIKKIVEK